MCKLLHLRLLTVAAFCLLLPASVYADPVRISFGENAGAFSFTLVGGAVNKDTAVITPNLGAFWKISFVIEDDNGALDQVSVFATVRHIMAPHGEPQGMAFEFNTGPIGRDGNGVVTHQVTDPLGHAAHTDNYVGVLTVTVVASQITGYTLHLEGKHCIGNDCPKLPPEVDLPEPTTMLLLGSGLAGVAIKTRKRLKRRKSG